MINYSLPDHQRIGNRVNFFAWLNNMRNLDLGILTNAGAPVNGTSGTFAGYAGKGCLLIDTTNGNLYMNTNTKASPTWTIQMLTSTVSGDITVGSTGISAIGANKVLTSMINAAAVTNAKLDPTTIQTVTLQLTNAQIKAIRATPITLVAAPGAGFFINPIAVMVELVYGGNNAFTANAGDNLAIKWQNGTTTAILTGGLQAFLQGTASAFNNWLPAALGSDFNVPKANVDNQPIVVHNIGAAEIAGNAANDNTINVIMKYAVHPTL